MDSFNPVPAGYTPKNILIIRLHSVGDVAITLPYCQALKNLFPSSNIDFLVSKDISVLPASLDIFTNVFFLNLVPLKTKNVFIKIRKLYRVLKLSSILKKRHYDVVLDLQNNKVSRIFRKSINPEYLGEFDRYSPLSASARTLNTFIKTGFNIEPSYKLKVNNLLLSKAKDMLLQNGWNKSKKIFLLNPAGLWKTRNWMIENYVRLAKLISYSSSACFLLLGDQRIKEKAEYISSYLKKDVINLVNKTTLAEAFGILQFVSAAVSEDSGLMHMAWVSGIPTIALLGSSRADWTSPAGSHTISLNSSDLECGNCMSPGCKYNDVHCLTRYSPEFVFEKLNKLLNNELG